MVVANAPGAAARHQPQWLKLDNAAKIYPATYTKKQNHQYCWSAVLSEDVDRAVLQGALAAVMPRFPSIAVALHRGLFWYYFETTTDVPPIEDDTPCPLAHRSFREIRRCGFRVRVSGARLSLDFFHAVTDGTGSSIFFKTLLAEYLRRKHGLTIPCERGVLDLREAPKAAELEDCFPGFAGAVARRGAEVKAYQLSGTMEENGWLNFTTLSYPLEQALACAKAHGVTLTGLMCAAMIQAVCRVQRTARPRGRQKDVAVTIPVNLRKMHPSTTLRNFSLYATPYVDPNQGEWTFDEICRRVRGQMSVMITPREMAACVAANVGAEKSMLVRLLPLPLKNLAMKIVYQILGNDSCCLSLSNLGEFQLPDAMYDYVRDVQCLLDAHKGAANSCGMMSYQGRVRLYFCRCYQEPTLEYAFYQVLREQGLRARASANAR
ncbi:MAG: hypothetical protein PHY12_09105 [Eubacteriales bacterium]|nr:hypothetical protein [Eubacteriales bacterium]